MNAPILIEKNAKEHVRVSLAEFKGHELIDVRVFAGSRITGDIVATKSGICLRVQKLPELIAALQVAEAEARARGWL